jgi:DNA ligase (NAD+)
MKKNDAKLIYVYLSIPYNMSIKQLVKLLENADDAYYNTGHPIMTDLEYDNLVDKLRSLDPENKYLNKIGTKRTNEMVKLPFKMGTLDKIKYEDTDKLNKWMLNKQNYVLSDKLDGMSCQCYKDNSGTIKLYTRGDFTSGKDITHLLKFIKIGNIPNNTSIRGELIISKDDFNNSTGYKNARNMIAGLINSKTPDINLMKKIQYIVYSIIHPKYKISNQLKLLKSMNFDVVFSKKIKVINNEILKDYLENRKQNSDFEIDGIVVTEDTDKYDDEELIPKHAFAFKHNVNFKEAIVVNIKWNVSKNSLLKPVVEIQPIELEGVTITNITGNNAKNIIDNQIGIGSKVLVVRSNDVIPKIEKVITVGKIVYPDVAYKWNENNVEFVVADNTMDDEILIKQLAHFFKTLNIKHISEETIKKLTENGYKSVIEILKADKTKLYTISSLGKKSIDKIYIEIDKAFDKITLPLLMDATHLFGKQGEKKLKLITDKYPDILQFKKKDMYDKLILIKGLGDISVNDFIDGFDDFVRFYTELNKYKKINIISTKVKGKLYADQVVVFSGFRNDELEQYIIENGGKITTSVSKNTTLLIVKDINEESSKITKAKELNIKIIQVDDTK